MREENRYSQDDLITVIIPVYNVKKYLKRCVNGVLAQTYKNLEVILVDDGSTDGCAELCDELFKTDKRVVVFHKQNGGLSSARNYGVRAANGKYITFVDSDDTIDEDYVETLYNSSSTVRGFIPPAVDSLRLPEPAYLLFRAVSRFAADSLRLFMDSSCTVINIIAKRNTHCKL